MRKRKFDIPKQPGFSLQLTSMVDMFTILLVFLLKSYSADSYHITPHQGVELPISTTQEAAKEALKITLTKQGLFLEDNELAQLENSDFKKQDLGASDPDFIKPLFAALDVLAKGEDAKTSIKNGEVILQADAKLSYNMLRKVMYTASMAGFPKLSMATLSAQ